MSDRTALPVWLKVTHGFGSVAYGVKENGFGTFLLLFYNQVIGLEAWRVSLALMIAMFVDALVDPMVGHFSDRTYTRWGKRLPWLYIAAIPLGLAWMLLWSVPPGIGDGVFLYLIFAAILVRVLVSACEVPSAALIPELTSDYDERTAIIRYRYLFGWAAGLLMLFLAYQVFLVPDETHSVGQLNEDGYWKFGVCGAILMSGAVLISAMGQHKRVARLPVDRPKKIGAGHAFREIAESLSHPAALILLSGALLMFASQGIIFAISNYLYIFIWQFSQTAFGLYPLLLLASVVCAFLLVTPVTRRFGKRLTVVYGGLLSLVFLITPLILLLLEFWPAIGSTPSTSLAFAFAFGANIAGVTAMMSGQSMVGDIVEASQLTTGRRSEGVFSAGWFFAQKCGAGVGIFFSGLIVSISGLPEKVAPGSVASEVIDSLALLYMLILIVLAVFTALIIWRFPIDRNDHEERLRQIAESAS